MTALENQTRQEIESLKIERIVRVNNIAQLIRSARQRANRALDDYEVRFFVDLTFLDIYSFKVEIYLLVMRKE